MNAWSILPSKKMIILTSILAPHLLLPGACKILHSNENLSFQKICSLNLAPFCFVVWFLQQRASWITPETPVLWIRFLSMVTMPTTTAWPAVSTWVIAFRFWTVAVAMGRTETTKRPPWRRRSSKSWPLTTSHPTLTTMSEPPLSAITTWWTSWSTATWPTEVTI